MEDKNLSLTPELSPDFWVIIINRIPNVMAIEEIFLKMKKKTHEEIKITFWKYETQLSQLFF